mmetsp:Transcript_3573/g.6205  ORF Transcript_3573/g.6205 Transcript_3573/m.6205 type:complete len:379 (-) Transcript_3573:491-1627(-)
MSRAKHSFMRAFRRVPRSVTSQQSEKISQISPLLSLFHRKGIVLVALLALKFDFFLRCDCIPRQETATHTVLDINFTNDLQVFESLRSLPIEKEDEIISKLHGEEWWYPLTCPTKSFSTGNYSVVVGYHVGMMNNWRNIVLDQLQTLYKCGVGELSSHLYVTYSNNDTKNTLEDLKAMFKRYPFAFKASFSPSMGQPVEGGAINFLHSHCQKREVHYQNTSHDTVAFYFHTKGSSRWEKDWRKALGSSFSYSNVLAWRKYMEYFLLERPQICINQIINEGMYGCGSWWLPQKRFYGGNFWAASCHYLQSLKPLEIYDISESKWRWMAEGWITEDLRNAGNLTELNKFYSSSQPLHGLYRYMTTPEDYSDYYNLRRSHV